MAFKRRSGFTLLELLVVLGVVLILTAIALPNLLQSQVRGQVTMARSHTRAVAQGLDLYWVDHHRFPSSTPRFPSDPLGIISHHQLSALTSPVGYISPNALFDPFGVVEVQIYDPGLNAGNDFPKLEQPNTERGLLYFHYPSVAFQRREPGLLIQGASAISIGPDRKDSLASFRPLAMETFRRLVPSTLASHPYNTVYEPTNGTRSSGDIGEFAGDAKRFAIP
jgi:prepilin-type N-terminal cleavage/methylation domain-containing protein